MSEDTFVQIESLYPQGPVRGDIHEGEVWETRDVTDLKTGKVKRFVERDG